MKKYLITGTAGFIGFHLANALLEKGEEVVGLDNINDYYDVNLKFARLKEEGIDRKDVEWGTFARSHKWPAYRFIRMNLEDEDGIMKLFRNERFDYVIHLAAQAGVRYSIDHPDAYIQSNIVGFLNILEACRHFPVRHLVYASSSSVYGNNEKVPFSEGDDVDNPVSLYAATKRSNELMAHTYSHLYGIKATGLRFFTVYGPWGRPDMAMWKFTEAILNENPLPVFGEGKLLRDFTYIDDIVNGITAILGRIEKVTPPPLMNIGNNNPVTVNEMVSELEQAIGKKAVVEYLPIQPGDVEKTYADISLINSYCGFNPVTGLKEGARRFVEWFKGYRREAGGNRQ
ncbi:MAG: GDP-mannose 4,6-dehydratase [Bacteroidales bacterium]|nr:GDP-mannose 4,6-dehydratase [Bacteroidales bacterium]